MWRKHNIVSAERHEQEVARLAKAPYYALFGAPVVIAVLVAIIVCLFTPNDGVVQGYKMVVVVSVIAAIKIAVAWLFSDWRTGVLLVAAYAIQIVIIFFACEDLMRILLLIRHSLMGGWAI